MEDGQMDEEYEEEEWMSGWTDRMIGGCGWPE